MTIKVLPVQVLAAPAAINENLGANCLMVSKVLPVQFLAATAIYKNLGAIPLMGSKIFAGHLGIAE
jgi:hypothetical protein